SYRNQWLDAIVANNTIQGVVALGTLADDAYQTWKVTPTGTAFTGAYAKIFHPTAPQVAESALLQNWNAGLQHLSPAITSPDVAGPLVSYGTAFTPSELLPIPPLDLPAGIPAWMGAADAWADRTGAMADIKRHTITITSPEP